MSRSQKVNEPETMSTASAYLYKEQAECVQQVHQYLVEHLDSRVTQAELAQRYHISLTSLKGAFKQVYGLPINTYLRRCRVQHAEQLLFTTDLSILEIAQRVGYDSPSRFAAMFKREKGINPPCFRHRCAPRWCCCFHCVPCLPYCSCCRTVLSANRLRR